MDAPYLAMIRANARESGARITISEEPETAVAGADFLTCDAMTWYGFEEETEQRLSVFLPRYQVNGDLLAKAPQTCRFLHCLPARRGEEVTAEVIDGPQSVVYDQAENRLYAELALCAAFLAEPADISRVENTPGPFAPKISALLRRLREADSVV